MKFLLCCTLVPEKYEVEIKEISNAANRFVKNFCTQLEKEHMLNIISYIGINIDEQTKNELKQCEKKDKKIRYVFKSRKYMKGILETFFLICKEMRKCDYIITYNVVYSWVFVPIVSKIMKKKSVLILADHSPVESYRSIRKRIYANVQQYVMRQYDYVVGLSEKTKKYLKPRQAFMCMEGGIAKEVYEYFEGYQEKERNKIIIMYSGILEEVTGVNLLIDAFEKISTDMAELIVTGDGSLADSIKNIAVASENINYLGCIPYEQYMKKISEADVLVNPRNMNLPENENNFPSKIMEYLATGKVIVSTKFPGWERYQEYIEFCESNSDALAECLVCSMNAVRNHTEQDFLRIRKFAKKFIWSEQVESIVNFLSKSL